jgi:hypothetical protein
MATYDFASGVTLTGVLSSGQVANGIRFYNTTGTTVTITEVARWKVPGNNQNHTVGVWATTDYTTPLATATFNAAAGTDNDWQWGVLSAPVDVPAGGGYFVLCSENSDQYNRQINGPVVQNQLTGVADIGWTQSATVGSGLPTTIVNLGGTNSSWGPVNFRYTNPEPGWTKQLINGHYVYTVEAATPVYSTNSARRDASAGDTILLPTATFVSGGDFGRIVIDKDIDVIGAGEGLTVIQVSNTLPSFDQGSAVLISGGGSFSHVTFDNSYGVSSANRPSPIIASSVNGWRIHHVTFNNGPFPGYSIYTNSYGLYDHCTFNGGQGQDEWVFIRNITGGTNQSWILPQSMGTADAVYGEDNTYNLLGYTDLNSGARGVVRMSRVNPTLGQAIKLDGHGYWSNQNPRQGVRHQEFYNIVFTGNPTSSQGAIEVRGGGGRIFGLRATTGPAFSLRDYGYSSGGQNFSPGTFQTPVNYPIFNQVGTGQWVDVSVTEVVAYQRFQVISVGDTDFSLFSTLSASPSVGSQAQATGPGIGTGRVWICPVTEPMYLWDNIKNTATTPAVWTRGASAPAAGAITLYRSQTGNPAATFTEKDIIKANRDFYGPAGFDTEATGAYTGTAADLLLFTAVGRTGQGFWVTDEGDWNKTFVGTKNAADILEGYLCEIVSVGTSDFTDNGAVINSVGEWFKATGPTTGSGTVRPLQGRLYVSNGATWDLDYTPYTYPHPLQGASSTPTQLSAEINAAGDTLTIVWSEAVENGADGGNGITLSASGGAITAVYSSGSGSDTYVYNLSGRTIQSGEIITDDYTQPGDGIKSVATGDNVETFSGASVTNNSAISGGMASGLRAFAALGAGF